MKKKPFPGLQELVPQLFGQVDDAIVRHDPLGLISMGAPRNEYQAEVATIIPRLPEATGPQDLRGIIHQEFVEWFAPVSVGPEEGYEDLAHEIWEYWESVPDPQRAELVNAFRLHLEADAPGA